jgi:hypothetical protein
MLSDEVVHPGDQMVPCLFVRPEALSAGNRELVGH